MKEITGSSGFAGATITLTINPNPNPNHLYPHRANNGYTWETNDAKPSNPCPCKYPTCNVNTPEHPLINRAAVAAVRAASPSWEAWEPEENPLRSFSAEQLQGLCGSNMEANMKQTSAAQVAAAELEFDAWPEFPANFDAREAYPQCVRPIRTQGHW